MAYHIPNVFDWIVPDHLAACVNPAYGPQVLEALGTHGIALVINLDEHSTAELLGPGVRHVHLPVQDLTPPTQAQLEQGVAAITGALADGQRVAVHCRAGLGRTGTLLAAYFVGQGLAPGAAIEQVRAHRPGSVETPEQEAAVAEFAARHEPSSESR